MFLRNLFEATSNEVAIIFGRFNPPHKGHRAAWEMASQSPIWYVGTNESTVGPKDPLPYDIKVEAMKAIWPEVASHIMPETSWLTMASKIYEQYPKATLLCLTDEEWVTKTILQYNGKEGQHGYYNFAKIEQKPTPRLSSATALRDAVSKGDREAFAQAAGVSADTKVAGKPFFDLVAEYLLPYQNAPKKVAKKKVPAPVEGAAEAVDIGREWMSDTELDQYVPDHLHQQWRELLGYDRNGNPSALWANLTGGYEPDVNDRQHRALMVKVANKWFAAKKIPNVKFFSVRDADDELEWLVQVGEQGAAEGSLKEFASGDGGEEDTLLKFARMWYNGDDAVQQKVESVLDRMGWEIGEIESEEGGAFVVRSGDENGNSYVGFAPDDLTEASLGTTLQWPEVVNKVSSVMKAMGWKSQRKSDDAFMFSTKGQETDDQWYIVMIENEGNGFFQYALGTVEEGDPHIGERDSLPSTEASVSELINAIREGFGLHEDAAGVGTITKQNTTKDVNKGTLRKMMKAYHLTDDLTEMPIQMNPEDPMNPMIYGHEKANPAELKTRMLRASGQLKDLAARAANASPAEWQSIAAHFEELKMNIEQIRHALAELAKRRKRGGTQSRGIDKNIS